MISVKARRSSGSQLLRHCRNPICNINNCNLFESAGVQKLQMLCAQLYPYLTRCIVINQFFSEKIKL